MLTNKCERVALFHLVYTHSTQLTLHMYMIHLFSGFVAEFFMKDKLFDPLLYKS